MFLATGLYYCIKYSYPPMLLLLIKYYSLLKNIHFILVVLFTNQLDHNNLKTLGYVRKVSAERNLFATTDSISFIIRYGGIIHGWLRQWVAKTMATFGTPRSIPRTMPYSYGRGIPNAYRQSSSRGSSQQNWSTLSPQCP